MPDDYRRLVGTVIGINSSTGTVDLKLRNANAQDAKVKLHVSSFIGGVSASFPAIGQHVIVSFRGTSGPLIPVAARIVESVTSPD